MENKIYKLKEKLIAKIEEETQDMNRLDVDRIAMLVDTVHHLAETEYYCAVADAMWEQKPVNNRASYVEQPVRSSYGQHQAATHQPSSMDALREQYRSAMPDERERMKHEALQLFGMM